MDQSKIIDTFDTYQGPAPATGGSPWSPLGSIMAHFQNKKSCNFSGIFRALLFWNSIAINIDE